MPTTDYRISNFDIDLNFGKIGENKVVNMFEGNGSIEVKTERGSWQKTGNIAIEVKYKGKPSGLSTTKAKTWIHLLSQDLNILGGFIFEVNKLKKRVKDLTILKRARIVKGGDNNDSTIVLLPIKEMFNYEI